MNDMKNMQEIVEYVVEYARRNSLDAKGYINIVTTLNDESKLMKNEFTVLQWSAHIKNIVAASEWYLL